MQRHKSFVETGHSTWKTKYQNSSKKFAPEFDYEHKVWGLIAFLRNLYVHRIHTGQDILTVDAYVTNELPEFLCVLHENFTPRN